MWGYKCFDSIERVHLFACKSFLRVSIKTPNDVVYGELGRYPLVINTLMKVVTFWFKLLRQPDSYYSKKAYNMLLDLHNRGKTTWVSHVKNVLCENGFEQVWLFGCGDINRFFCEFKDRLYSSFLFRWFNHVQDSNNMGIYSNIKNVFGREKYVEYLNIGIYRSALAKIRMGASRLNVHRFRFSDEIHKKNCPFCLDKPEDEFHFLFVCPVYSDIRRKYLPPVECSLNPFNLMCDLLSIKSHEDISSVAKIYVLLCKSDRMFKEMYDVYALFDNYKNMREEGEH